MKVLFALMGKEVLHIIRDRRSLFAALALPILQLLLFGYAINFDVTAIDIAVADQDRTAASRDLIQTATADGTVRVVRWLDSEAEVDDLVESGQIRMALIIPPRLETGLSRGKNVPVQLIVDGTDATFAGQALSQLAGALGDRYVRDLGAQVRMIGGPRELPGLDPRPRVLFNESLNSTWYIVPGLIAVIISMLAAMLTSQCIAREYEQGTIEQILVSRVSGPVLMVAKLTPYVGLGLIQVATVTLASRFLFGVPLRGSLVLFAISTLLYLFGSMALGLMLSAVLKSQQVAMQVSIIASMLPSLLLSGFIFPISNMPAPLQAISYIVPARYFIVIARGLFLKGADLQVLLPELQAMVVYAVLMVLLAASSFRRTLS